MGLLSWMLLLLLRFSSPQVLKMWYSPHIQSACTPPPALSLHCMCIYVCICVYIHTYIHTYIYIYISSYASMCFVICSACWSQSTCKDIMMTITERGRSVEIGSASFKAPFQVWARPVSNHARYAAWATAGKPKLHRFLTSVKKCKKNNDAFYITRNALKHLDMAPKFEEMLSGLSLATLISKEHAQAPFQDISDLTRRLCQLAGFTTFSSQCIDEVSARLQNGWALWFHACLASASLTMRVAKQCAKTPPLRNIRLTLGGLGRDKAVFSAYRSRKPSEWRVMICCWLCSLLGLVYVLVQGKTPLQCPKEDAVRELSQCNWGFILSRQSTILTELWLSSQAKIERHPAGKARGPRVR